MRSGWLYRLCCAEVKFDVEVSCAQVTENSASKSGAKKKSDKNVDAIVIDDPKKPDDGPMIGKKLKSATESFFRT